MKRFVQLLILLVIGCSLTAAAEPPRALTPYWIVRQLEAPPVAGNYNIDDPKAFEIYVIDVNNYAYTVYLYARAINENAKTRGVRIPKLAPLCGELQIPRLHPIPKKINLDENADTAEEVSRALANEFRSVLGNYRSDRESFNRAVESYRESCLFW